jgi:hypothetical protein
MEGQKGEVMAMEMSMNRRMEDDGTLVDNLFISSPL